MANLDVTTLPKRTVDGFLLDSRAWTEEMAQALVSETAILLDERHFELIHFIREYHARFHHLPNNRMFIKAVHGALGPDKGSSIYLNLLFDGNPVRNACLAAGLPKPPGCL
jgi:tRNA 2-thiouridine synthesizing protein E